MSSLKNLGEIIKDKFKDKKVYIPLYQRNYKWSPEMAGKLAQDLLEQFNKDNNKDYNLGVLTFYKPNDDEIQILDGQQRMITLSLIVKALGKIDDWFKLLFERDMGFEDTNKYNPRYNYIYSGIDSAGVDVTRMISNLGQIQIKQEIDKGKFYEYILDHVKFLYRETKSEPIDEFLNMNFNKTPFCAADHIKAYMVLDADANKKDITIAKIQELWKKLERVLFQMENCSGMENEMFSLIKKNYNEEILNMNRIEILFYNRYLEEQNKGQNATKTASKYHNDNNSLKDEYDRLSYYYDVMKSVLDEIAIVDKAGNRHPNYNALNAYNLLCSKNNNARFFEIIGKEENIKNKTDVTEALKKHFNLTGTSHEKINNINNSNAQNQFMETMLSSQNDYKTEKSSISEKYYIKDNNKFKQYYDLFNGCFTEYVALIEMGKKANSGIDKTLEDGKKILSNLLENSNIEKIKIPSIQRDYVMGSSNEYLKSYLQHISFRYSWSCYCMFKSNKTEVEYSEDQYIALENILFNNNDSKKILKLVEISRGDANRESKYNKYKPSLINPPNVKDFRRYGEGSDYAEFCKRVNELVELNVNFNNSIINEKDYDMKFNTGCIMGHLDDDKTFWVYDGQQRLVTSVVLLALTRGKQNNELRKSLKKFSFEGRNGANKCLEILLDADVSSDEITNKMRNYIDDKSSYSIYKLIKNYNILKDDFTIKIVIDYLLNGMEFEFAMVDKIDDVEQLFIEMNEGVKLTPDEQYKAEFNYTASKILDAEKAKALLRMIDNEWFNFYKTEEEEVKWIKYCVKMACFEINGYDSSFKDGSLQGLNVAVIELAERAIDKVVEANYKSPIEANYKSPIEAEIGLWVRLLILSEFKKDKAEYMSSDNKIYFEEDFNNFIMLYQKFASMENKIDEKTCNTKCFEIIKEFRANKCLVVPGEPTRETEESADTEKENPAEKIYKQMLKNRIDQFEFCEISKWECYSNSSSYDIVEENKDKSYALSQVQPQNEVLDFTITKDMNVFDFIDELSVEEIKKLVKNVIENINNSIKIDKKLAKSIVLNNPDSYKLIFADHNKRTNANGEEYYSYANCQWSEVDKQNTTNNEASTDLSKTITEAFKKGTIKTSIEVNVETFKNCKQARTIYNILTGFWYSERNKTEFNKDTNENEICVKSVSETNFNVFKWQRIDGADVADLLYQYKFCHNDVKLSFELYIVQYYYEKALEKALENKCIEYLYYIAKCYLKGNVDLRKKMFEKYSENNKQNISEDIKQKIRPLFLDEDFTDKNSDEYKAYCKQRGYPTFNTYSELN